MAALIIFLSITLLGAMVFALASGFARTEQERAQAREAAVAGADAHPAAAVEAQETCVACGAPQGRLSLDELLAQVEQRVRLETIAVSQFIEQPSVESLHGLKPGRTERANPEPN